MNEINTPIVYKGMTAHEIEELYDDIICIPDFYSLLQKNRELAKEIKNQLNPIQDIPYGSEDIQRLDIYKPKHANKLPVLIDIHGGGWVAGSKNARSIPAKTIMSQGVMWVPIDYGLAPTYRLEEMIHHVGIALNWIYNNINQYGGDPDRIYLSGQSAGAHLAAATLMPDWHTAFDIPSDFIKGLIVLSGVYDLCSLVQSVKTETQEILKLTSDEAKRFSPFYHLPKNAIPIVIAYGGKEPFAYRLEAENYANELEKSGCSISLITVLDANHFDMINEIGNSDEVLFNTMIKMIRN